MRNSLTRLHFLFSLFDCLALRSNYPNDLAWVMELLHEWKRRIAKINHLSTSSSFAVAVVVVVLYHSLSLSLILFLIDICQRKQKKELSVCVRARK